jgi:hypothetical protein
MDFRRTERRAGCKDFLFLPVTRGRHVMICRRILFEGCVRPVPADELHSPVRVFDESSAAFHPISVIMVDTGVQCFDGRLMDMAANGSVQTPGPNLPGDLEFEAFNVGQNGLHRTLDCFGKRPFRLNPDPRQADMKDPVQPDKEVVSLVPEMNEERRAADQRIEPVPVKNQKTSAVGRLVNGLFQNVNVPEGRKRVVEKKIEHFPHGVVIPFQIDHPCSVAGLPEDFLEDGIMGFRPIPGSLHRPEVDNVSDQEKSLRFGVAEKMEQSFGLAPPCSEVNVRNPDCPVFQGRLLVRRWSRSMRKAEMLSAA